MGVRLDALRRRRLEVLFKDPVGLLLVILAKLLQVPPDDVVAAGYEPRDEGALLLIVPLHPVNSVVLAPYAACLGMPGAQKQKHQAQDNFLHGLSLFVFLICFSNGRSLLLKTRLK